MSWLKQQEQTHLLGEIEEFSENEKNIFFETLLQLSRHFINKHFPATCNLYPPEKISPFRTPIEDQNHVEQAIELIKKQKVACILLAGGDGSRLSYNKPKGCFPISTIQKKSLFQIHFEKINVLQKKLGIKLTLFVLTSYSNHLETVQYLTENDFFGLDESYVYFAIQPSFPLVDKNNHWFFKSKGVLAVGPNGNGGLFQALKPLKDNLLSFEQLMIISIDNPLAMPFDLPLIAINHLSKHDLSLRCFKRVDEEECVGIFSHLDGRVAIVDYGNFEDSEYKKRKGNDFEFPYGNLNIFCLSSTFLKSLFESCDLPIHWVEKNTKSYSKNEHSKKIKCFKSEKFLTDLLLLTKNVGIVNSERNEIFAPLKNREGVNDIASVQKALLEHDRKIYQKLTGKDPGNACFELSMDFHYQDKELKSFLEKLPHLDKQYIDPVSSPA